MGDLDEIARAAMINNYRQSQWQDLDAPPHSEPTTLAKHHNG